MFNQNLVNTLKLISQRLNENKVIWAIVGSTNLALQGIEITPRDIDIILTIENLVKLKNIFPEYSVTEIEEKQSTRGSSYWRVLIEINGIEVEILGEKENGVYTDNLLAGNKLEILLDDTNIFCLTLQSEIYAYRETGRQNRVEMIEKFLLIQNNK